VRVEILRRDLVIGARQLQKHKNTGK
jgi:hypothetical protein